MREEDASSQQEMRLDARRFFEAGEQLGRDRRSAELLDELLIVDSDLSVNVCIA